MKTDRILIAVRYVYLLVFFLLLSGVFSPVITGNNFELALVGTLVLFCGLIGTLLVWKSRNRPEEKKYLIIGFVIIFLSLMGIMALAHESWI